MHNANINMGPPPDSSDSEDDYDGFYFSDEIKKNKSVFKPIVAIDQALYDAALIGNLTVVKEQIGILKWDVNAPVKGGYPLLFLACQNGHLNLVEYLIEVEKANVNRQVDSIVPLMLACSCTSCDAATTEQMVTLLLAHNAIVNVADKFGTTPFMLACKYGHINVVRQIIKDVSLDAVDNYGCTSIFYAVEHNHPEIVKLLIDAGVNTALCNSKGYTPRQLAQFQGFFDLLELFPNSNKNEYVVPSHYLSYNKLSDNIPRIFSKLECPEYFQEINCILITLEMQIFLSNFAKHNITLGEFLIMNDEKLKQVDIKLPLFRNKLRKGILDFHLHHWSKQSIAHVSRNVKDNFYIILMLTANHLQQLIIIQAALRFIAQNQMAGELGDLSSPDLLQFRQTLESYRKVIIDLKKTVKYLSTFSPMVQPLYIDYDVICAERQRKKMFKYFKYSVALGVSAFIILKMCVL